MTQQTILIVDDSEIVLDVTRARLEEAGYRVETRTRATGSVSLILQLKPDLVLLDVNMPTLKGDSVARTIAGTSRVRKTIVLLHSSLDPQSLERLVRQCGAHGYIQKTENAYALLRQIRRYLGPGPTQSSSTLKRLQSSKEDGLGDRAKPGRRAGIEKTHRVLLVDRDMTNLARMREFLRERGCPTEFALSVEQAERKLVEPPVPVVVVVSADLPNQGVDRVFQTATAHDPSWSERFILMCADPATASLPPEFRGRVLTLPIAHDALAQALDDLISPTTRVFRGAAQ